MKLEPRETDIDGRPGQLMGDGRIRMKWHVCLPSGHMVERMTQTSKVSPKIKKGSKAWDRHLNELREKAHKKADELIREDENAIAEEKGRRKWRYEDKAADYVGTYLHKESKHGNGAYLRDEDGRPKHVGVATQALEDDTTITESTRQRYRHYVGDLHDAVDDMTLGDLCCVDDFRALEAMLRRAEREHGSSTLKHLRVILNGYVYQQLKLDGLVKASPIPELSMKSQGVNKGTSRRADGKRSGEVAPDEVLALTPDERHRAVEWMLADPCEAPAGRRGGNTLEESAYHRRALVEMTLVQATMGLRLHECLTLTAGNVKTVRGRLVVHVTYGNSKTHGERTVACIDQDYGDAVTRRIVVRCKGLTPQMPVFASCKNHAKPWDQHNAQKSLRKFYDEMADACGIPTLRKTLTHVWRATLNGEYEQLAAEGKCRLTDYQRASLFGHDLAVNRKNYTKELPAEEQLALGMNTNDDEARL